MTSPLATTYLGRAVAALITFSIVYSTGWFVWEVSECPGHPPTTITGLTAMASFVVFFLIFRLLTHEDKNPLSEKEIQRLSERLSPVFGGTAVPVAVTTREMNYLTAKERL